MSSLLTTQLPPSVKLGSVGGRPSSLLSRRVGTPTVRRRDATQSTLLRPRPYDAQTLNRGTRREGYVCAGGNAVRRIGPVRANASGEPRREQKNGLDLRRDARTRYQWQWHENQGAVNSWSHSSSCDLDLEKHFTPSSSEVWDCYNGSVRPQPPSGNNGEMSIEESSSDASRTMTPEQEFLTYTMNLPHSQRRGVDLMSCFDDPHYNGTKEVFVLLFGVGEAATEGIYSLRSHCHETGLHHETIICFESSEDAARFSGLLEASMPHVSTVHTIKSAELVQFCTNSGYACRLELTGSTLRPPEFNVGITDWERSMKLRQGHYQVLDKEPDFAEVTLENEETSSSVLGHDPEDEILSRLDTIRANLERLLPKDDETSEDLA